MVQEETVGPVGQAGRILHTLFSMAAMASKRSDIFRESNKARPCKA
jgi:hypothetical protein